MNSKLATSEHLAEFSAHLSRELASSSMLPPVGPASHLASSSSHFLLTGQNLPTQSRQLYPCNVPLTYWLPQLEWFGGH